MLRLTLTLALTGGLTCPAARRWFSQRRRRRRERTAVMARSAGMGDYCAAVGRRLHGGDTLLQALRSGADDGPMSLPLRQVADEHERGVTLARAIQRWAAREQTSEAALLSTAVTLATDPLGAQPRLFDHVAATLRVRADAAAEARVHVAQARASVWVVSALPWAVALALLAEGGAAARVLTSTPLGWFCAATAALLELAGIAWMRAAVRAALR